MSSTLASFCHNKIKYYEIKSENVDKTIDKRLKILYYVRIGTDRIRTYNDLKRLGEKLILKKIKEGIKNVTL